MRKVSRPLVDHVWATTMAVFLHVVALDGCGNLVLRFTEAAAQGTGWFVVLTNGLLTGGSLPVIGVSAAVLVIIADSVLVSRLWDKTSRDVGANASDDLRALSVVGLAPESMRDGAPVDAPLRPALWGILGLTAIALGSIIFVFFGELAGLVKAWPDAFTIGAVVIGMALILSAAILSGFLMLTARLNAVSAMASEAVEAHRHVERAKVHLAAIARHRGPLKSPG